MQARIPYSPQLPTVARVPFKFSGKQFYPGDSFPGDALPEGACPERRRAQMWTNRMLECVMDLAPAPAKSPEAEPLVPPKEPTAPQTPPPAGKAKIKSTGFGLFSVLGADGAVVAMGLTKDKASTMAAEINETRRGAGESASGAGAVCPPVPGAPSAAPTAA
ncbi:hypothetical protein KL86PLE_100243 [uncultured Pleomorphomonas sp.]|uniref:Uncharacterized protein n=1 Tax=uncultured Pleomorphomonas sp. TaxID=442121 RepID=A0A212L1V7_9HYPH|nr:hypothetical protein [uncultured Pleomorphomonas sp.]SCM71508.1 hypothetical protein KL86PLE_100243 [uncultured Pleomorphomonas sp.]